VTPSAEPTRHSFTLRSHLSETSHARELVLPFAAEAGFSEERCFDIQVASSEACANAIEHSPSDFEVEFAVLVYPDRLEVQVEGRGEFELPAAAARERVHRGLGLPLMAKLSDHLSLYSGPRGGTLVALTFYRPGLRDQQETDDVTPPWIREVLEENELVAAITGVVPVGLYVLDPELRFRWANAAYREFLEDPYRSQPLAGIYIGEAVPGSGEMGSLEILRSVSRTGEPAFFPEYEYVGFTRGTTYWRWEILPLKQGRPRPPWDVLVVISEITEQVEQRRRLEFASRSYQALAENSGLGLALCRTVYDSEGKAVDFEFVEVNRLHRAFTGLPPEEVVGRKVSGVIPGFSQDLIDVQNQVASSGEPREEEIYEPNLGRWYRLNLYSPEPGYFVSLFTDITANKAAGSERERAEEAQQDSEKRYRTLFECSPDAIFLTISTGEIVAANPGATAIFGYSEEEFRSIGRDGVLDVNDPRLAAGLVERQRTGTVQARELIGIRKNGERFPVEVDSVILPGTPDTSFVILRDKTERESAEDALRESERRLRQQWEELRLIYESVPAGLALMDRELRYIRINERLAEINGLPAADHIGRTVREVIPVLADEVEGLLRPVFETGQPIVELELKGETAAQPGVERAWIEQWVPIRGEDGRVELLSAVVLEVTERVERERERVEFLAQQRQLNQELAAANEALVLSNVALRESEKRHRILAEENEHLYRQQLDIAENLQLALLNIPSEIGPVRFGHIYRSATEAARVGGDFYDAFEVKDGQIALLIGDVSGHGIEAARTATLVKGVIHAFTHQPLRTHEVLKCTNGLLIEKKLPGFVTVFLGTLDTKTGQLRYSSAGHPDTLLRRASGTVERLGGGSSPLGAYPDATWKPQAVDLEANDLLVLYTDGVIEARRDGELFGEKRLETLVGRKRISPERLPHLILDQVSAFSEGTLQDDVAILTVLLPSRP
jgi:PAS domain S-box-containing protein